LVQARDLELTVPGAYDPFGPLVTISSFNHTLQVISSKQRPRKVIIRGSDGNDYTFLLKGHEDPRQDERVMQLFGLRYSIVTLSENSGLIGWVPNCDTLHTLIREYREKKGVMLSMEHKVMQSYVNDPEQLSLFQKVQAFEAALEVTKGNDLQQILWLKSPKQC
uniref:PI3K/PI4K domain-containing protein n=1 Tax=Gongylonema pulchrum TaxID=637853 RepID=A0A183D733_9BILA